MNRLYERHGFTAISRSLRVLELRLAGIPELRSHAEDIAAMRQRLSTAQNALTEIEEQRQAAGAQISYLDSRVDELVVTMGQTAYLQFGRDRTQPGYTRLFPVAPSKMVADSASERQDRFVTVLVETIRNEEAYVPLRPMADEIMNWMEELRGAITQRKDLYVREAQARAVSHEIQDTARRFYNGLYHRFMVTIPDNRPLVESLFPAPDHTSPATPTPTDVPAE